MYTSILRMFQAAINLISHSVEISQSLEVPAKNIVMEASIIIIHVHCASYYSHFDLSSYVYASFSCHYSWQSISAKVPSSTACFFCSSLLPLHSSPHSLSPSFGPPPSWVHLGPFPISYSHSPALLNCNYISLPPPSTHPRSFMWYAGQ